MRQKDIPLIIGAIAFVVIVTYACWQLERKFNYKFGYESKVQAEVQKQLAPLEKRVAELEQRLEQLEKK